MLLKMFYGFCMALADSVPGVSGGTIAFILGFYEKLLDCIHNIFSKDKNKQKKSIDFILKLILGWFIGMALSVSILSNLFEKHIYTLSSAFLGLTCISIPFVIIAEKNDMKNKYGEIIFSILGIVLVIIISSFKNSILNQTSINFNNLNFAQFIYILISAMIAITAMILPGISGSTLLLIFGIYVPTVNAIKSFISFDFSVFKGLLALGLGVILGLALSIKYIRNSLKKQKSKMLYFIIGLMIGSLYAISMGPTTLNEPLAPLSTSTFNILAFIVGMAILLILELIKKFLEKNSNN